MVSRVHIVSLSIQTAGPLTRQAYTSIVLLLYTDGVVLLTVAGFIIHCTARLASHTLPSSRRSSPDNYKVIRNAGLSQLVAKLNFSMQNNQILS